jgi:hypothetical protein
MDKSSQQGGRAPVAPTKEGEKTADALLEQKDVFGEGDSAVNVADGDVNIPATSGWNDKKDGRSIAEVEMETKGAAGPRVAPKVVLGEGDSAVDVNAGVVDIQGSSIGGTLKKNKMGDRSRK